MKVHLRDYLREDNEHGKCFQVLPCVNYWFNHNTPNYRGIFVGWLFWGVVIEF